MTTPYNDRAYRAEKARIRHEQPACWRGCGRVATTPDHVPPLAAHDHVAGTGCCVLLPACEPCNYGAGARHGNRMRARGGRHSHAVRRW